MKRNANGIAAVLKNWSQVEAALTSATEAAGTASAENDKYMESMAGKISSLQASWQSLANTILSSDFLKTLIDGANTLVSGLDKINKSLGSMPALLATIFGVLSGYKNIGRGKMFPLEDNMPIVVIVLFGYEQFRYYQC